MGSATPSKFHGRHRIGVMHGWHRTCRSIALCYLQRIVDNETLCIVSPHLLGQTADIRRTKAIAMPFGVSVIEDATQSMGRKTTEGWVGALGDVGFSSLARGRNVTAGSGSVIVTRSNDLAHKLAKIYANVPEESLPPADRKCRLGLRRAHPSVVPRHGRVTDRPPSPAETREAGASNTGQ